MSSEPEKITLSFRIDPDVHKDIKIICLQYERVTIQAMGELFVNLYFDGYIEIYNDREEPIRNHKKLKRAPNEKKITFRIDKNLHKKLRNILEKRHLTFQQIAEKFFTDLVNENINFNFDDSKLDRIDDKYRPAIYIFEKSNQKESKESRHLKIEY